MTDRVAVVGAGVFGAWTAHHLLRQGCEVTLIDAWGPANSRASSGGESRLTRAAYGKDAIYTRLAMDSLPQWKTLSAAAGLPIFVPAGVLFFFATEEAYFRDSAAAHQELGLPTEALGRFRRPGVGSALMPAYPNDRHVSRPVEACLAG